MRLIDAEALIAEYDRTHEGEAGKARKLMEDAPTVEAEPVRHGKWFIGTVPYFVCSECKNRTPLRWDERCGYVLDYRSPYCPNCGARMEERKEE